MVCEDKMQTSGLKEALPKQQFVENYDIFHCGLLKRSCNQFALTLQCPLTRAKHAYVTYRDIRDVKHFKNRTVIAIKAPPETRLEVPDPKEVLIVFSS